MCADQRRRVNLRPIRTEGGTVWLFADVGLGGCGGYGSDLLVCNLQ